MQLFPNEKNWTLALPEIVSFLKFDDAVQNDVGDDGGWYWKTLEIHHGFPGMLHLQRDSKRS